VGLELQGRVISMNEMLAQSMMPLGFLAAGPLVDKIFEPLMASEGSLANSVGLLIGAGPGRGLGLLIIVIGAIYLLLASAGFRHRPLRFMEDALPDAVPDAVLITDKDRIQQQVDQQLSDQTI
jgi:hypothetical protein